jgi:hypothetical protein
MHPPKILPRKPSRLWVGVDPGVHGAIGVLDEKGRFISVEDMPITKEGRQGEFDITRLCAHIRHLQALCADCHVFLEWPTTRPGEAAESSKRFGVGLGLLEGAWTMAGCRPIRVAPNLWKGALGLLGKADDPLRAREQAVRMAEEFVVGMGPGTLRGVRGGLLDGRAEALLVAWWAVTRTREGLAAQPEDVRMARLLFGGGGRRKRMQPPL